MISSEDYSDKDDLYQYELYEKIKHANDETQIDICKSIIDEVQSECVHFVCEENIVLEENIFCAIERFLVELSEPKKISKAQYKILSRYFESVKITKDIENRIIILMNNAFDRKLKKFLGIWIGIDEVLNGICYELAKQMKF